MPKNLEEWKTIHIFGYGETQIIGKDLSKKVTTSELTKVQAVVDHIFSKKPADNDTTINYHAIHIHKDMFADFVGMTTKYFRTLYADLDESIINELVTEFRNLR